MFCVRSALAATYSFDFTLVISVVCDHVTFDVVSVIGFEVTVAALEAFLIEMYIIRVIPQRMGSVGFKFTDLASHYPRQVTILAMGQSNMPYEILLFWGHKRTL